MPRTGTFLEAVTSYYSNLAFGALSAMRSTQEDLRTGNFQVSKAVGEAVSFWLDASEGWWSALLVTASEPLPTVFLRVGLAGTATQEVKVLVPANPEFTGLFRIGGGESIPAARVSITPLSKGDGLEVKLTGLSESLKKGTLPPGLYQGLVHIGDRPLVTVVVRVDAPPPESKPGAVAQAGQAVQEKAQKKKKKK